jgi:hypothetical protein
MRGAPADAGMSRVPMMTAYEKKPARATAIARTAGTATLPRYATRSLRACLVACTSSPSPAANIRSIVHGTSRVIAKRTKTVP